MGNAREHAKKPAAAELTAALQFAHQQICRLENQLAEYMWLEESLRKRTKELNERSKELYCVCAVCVHLSGAKKFSEMAQGLCELLPEGFQFPGGTSVRIEAFGREYMSRDFKSSEHNISREIRARGEAVGLISVHVAPVFDRFHETAVLPEERMLLETAAALIGEIIGNRNVR